MRRLLSGAVGAHRGHVFDGWVIALAIATHPTPTCAAEPGAGAEDPADEDRAVGGKCGLTAGAVHGASPRRSQSLREVPRIAETCHPVCLPHSRFVWGWITLTVRAESGSSGYFQGG